MFREEVEFIVIGCWIVIGLGIGKGFIFFSFFKKKIKIIYKIYYRDNKKMESSVDKGERNCFFVD